MNREAYNVSGKDKCRILKRIRAEIAAQNDIDLVIEECPYKGECRGTCPRCEAEVRYLEAELEKRRDEEKEVRLDGLFGDLPDPAPLGKESPEGDEDERWAVLPEGDFNVEDDLFLSGPEGREPRLPHLPLRQRSRLSASTSTVSTDPLTTAASASSRAWKRPAW